MRKCPKLLLPMIQFDISGYRKISVQITRAFRLTAQFGQLLYHEMGKYKEIHRTSAV